MAAILTRKAPTWLKLKLSKALFIKMKDEPQMSANPINMNQGMSGLF